MRIRVIGVGSPSGDDAAGVAVAERLMDTGLGAATEVEAWDRPGLDLLDRLVGADAVILVDAMRSGRDPGTVRRIDVGVLEPGAGLSSHALGVAETVSLAIALGRRLPRVEIVGIEAGDALEGPPCAAVERGIERACKLVRELAEEVERGVAVHVSDAKPGA